MVFFTFRAEVMMDDSNSREPVDWRLCMLCQQSKGAVVLNPRTESYQKVLDVVYMMGNMLQFKDVSKDAPKKCWLTKK